MELNLCESMCVLSFMSLLLNTRPPSLHKHSALPAVQHPLGFVSSSGFWERQCVYKFYSVATILNTPTF